LNHRVIFTRHHTLHAGSPKPSEATWNGEPLNEHLLPAYRSAVAAALKGLLFDAAMFVSSRL
jgi:hypothetical protein